MRGARGAAKRCWWVRLGAGIWLMQPLSILVEVIVAGEFGFPAPDSGHATHPVHRRLASADTGAPTVTRNLVVVGHTH